MAENQNVPGRSKPPKTPGWVKVFFIVIVLLLVIVVLAHLMGLQFDHGAGTLLQTFASYTQYSQHALLRG